MLRTTSVVRMGLISAVVLLAAFVASGAVVFTDDFTSAASADNWVPTDGAPNVVFNNGVATINNTTANLASYTYTLSQPMSTFTLDFELKSMSAKTWAGMMFCKQDGFNGYLLTIGIGTDGNNNEIDLVYVYNMYKTPSDSIKLLPVYYIQSPMLKSLDNRFTISKDDTTFHLSHNGEFLGQFTDATYSSGDIAMLVGNGMSATFGPVTMTDQFTAGVPRSKFSDNFDNTSLSKYWSVENNSGGTQGGVYVSDGTLTVTNDASTVKWVLVDVPGLNNNEFEVLASVKRVSGDSAIYGIALAGDGFTMHFAITGEKNYGVLTTGGGQVTLKSNNVINGSSGAFDMLAVKKISGAYKFYVNETELDISGFGISNSQITRVGMFAYNGMSVLFDDFYAGPIGGSSSIAFGRDPGKTIRARSVIRNQNQAFYDLRGRKRYTVTPAAAATGRMPTRAAGMYVNENGRNVVTKKNRR